MNVRALLCACLFLVLAAPTAASAQGKRKPKRKRKPAAEKIQPEAKGKARVRKTRRGQEKLFDFTGLQLEGATRMPQLLYFLDRANSELDRASLKRRSFVPAMVRSLEEEPL